MIGFAAVMVVSGVAATYLRSDAATVTAEATKGNKAPDFALKSVEGKEVKFSDFKGKAVILNFWGTWCPPCRAEIPDMIELQKQYGGEKFTFVGVTINERKGVEAVKEYMTKTGMNYPVLMEGEETFGKYTEFVPEKMRGAVPTTFVINSAGEIIDVFVGMKDKASFEAAIKKATTKI
jgi:peroxiredoxin